MHNYRYLSSSVGRLQSFATGLSVCFVCAACNSLTPGEDESTELGADSSADADLSADADSEILDADTIDAQDVEVEWTGGFEDPALTMVVSPIPVALDSFGQTLDLSRSGAADRVLIVGDGADVGEDGFVGSAHVFRSEAGGAWLHETRLTPRDAARQHDFARSVAIDGDVAVVGATHPPAEPGAAYIFERIGGQWQEHAAPLRGIPPVPDDGFGQSAAVDGDVIAIGAPFKESREFGAVYLYRREGASYEFEQKLTTSSAEADRFGLTVAVSGDFLAVGAPTTKSTDGSGSVLTGAVFLFEHGTDGSWRVIQQLRPEGARDYAYFGAAIDLKGGRLVVGAPGVFGIDLPGSAHVYDRQADGTWAEVAVLTASDGQPWSEFGSAVALDGDSLVVGADSDDRIGRDSGAAYVFSVSADESWVETAKLRPADLIASDYFGSAVGLIENLVAVGCEDDDIADIGAGSVYLISIAPE